MAQFQERIYHSDKTEKHTLTTGDVMFLAELQKELNTQPNMGNADPVFWAIAQDEEYPTAEDYADGCVVVDSEDGSTVAHDMAEFAAFLDNDEIDEVTGCTVFNNSCTIKFENGEKTSAYGLAEMIGELEDYGIGRFELRYYKKQHEVVKDTLFLTHKDCEDHLGSYGYNYKPDAHAFAMTAVRSPRYERLIRLIRTVDWGSLSVSGAQGGGT